MGMIAGYMMIDDKTLNKLIKLDSEELSEALMDIEEEETFEFEDIDKSWDGLHFILTGESATEPIEGNKLSEAVLGIHLFLEDDSEEFVAYTKRDELPEIISALEGVDMKKLRQDFNPQLLHDADLYPDIWTNEEKNELFDYLESGYSTILSFYKEAVAKNMHIVVSIL